MLRDLEVIKVMCLMVEGDWPATDTIACGWIERPFLLWALIEGQFRRNNGYTGLIVWDIRRRANEHLNGLALLNEVSRIKCIGWVKSHLTAAGFPPAEEDA